MIRVLFVDDEPRVLDGLRRMLRPNRHEWEMEFVTSGPEALERLEAVPFDVVVSDMRMPGMNGVELLGEVKKRRAESIRIVLSGHAERDAIGEVVDRTHQYLAKPCEPDVLKATVERAYALRRVLRNEELKRLVSQLVALPSLPTLYEEVMAELRKPEPSLRKLGDTISTDMGMSAKILQLVNSAFFGTKRTISSVEQAVMYLGLETIGTLVLRNGIFQQFDLSTFPEFSLEAIWAHSNRTASYAMAIAKREGLEQVLVDHCFTAGMLHDTGKLVLATNLQDQYAPAFRAIRERGAPSAPTEREFLNATHGEVGAYLLGLWGLPDPVVESVAFHTAPVECVAHGLDALAVVHLADAFAQCPDPAAVPDDGVHVDREYLESAGLSDRWSAWRAECTALEYDPVPG